VLGVNDADGWYTPFPDTVAVPTVVPPLAHDVGAVACGPKTVNVTVPVAPAVPPESVAEIDEAPIAVPAVPAVTATADSAVAFVTTVEAIPAPQALLDALFEPSPP
jgi:hypothetical protein